MIGSICGLDCAGCSLKDTGGGCAKTSGQPFGGECVVAADVYKRQPLGCVIRWPNSPARPCAPP